MQMVNERFRKWNNMHVGEVITKSTTIHEKYFHARNNSEMLVIVKMVLVQANMYQNDNKTY